MVEEKAQDIEAAKPEDGGSSSKGKDKKGKKGKKEKVPKPPGVSIPSLWRYAKGYEIFMVFCAAAFSLGSGVLQPLVIIVLGDVLNGFGSNAAFFELTPKQFADAIKASGADPVAEAMPTILKFVYFGIGILFASYGAQSLWVFTSERLTRDIRIRYVRAILRQDIGWHDKAEEGSLTTRLALDTQLIQDGIGDKFGVVLTSISGFIGGFVVAFVKGWKLALVMFACMPILIIVGVNIGFQIKKFTQASQDMYARAGAIAEQAISGFRTVTSFSLQQRFVNRYDGGLKDAETGDIKKGRAFGIGVGMFMFTLYGILGLAFWYSSRLVMDGEMNGGDVLVVFFAMLIGAMSLMGIPSNLQAVTSAQGAAWKVYNVIERVPVIDSLSPDGLKPEVLQGHIEFKDCQFNYPSRPDVIVLQNLSLIIKPGQTVAFVGPSGSGKSTSVSLVQRFYDVLAGEVLIDGRNVKEYNLHWLREHVGLVGQEPVLFNMSIKENILMGTSKPVTEEKLIEVCKMANCHNFITMLPHGYNTQVGEHGGMLSGGQKQRIAIARALIKDPQVLLLDEATSALDTASERIVQKALDAASKNRTTITIAHRLSTIRYADLICVMAKGVLVEQGTHDELIELGGVYKNLVEKQKINMNEKEGDAGVETEVFNVSNQDALRKADQVEVAIGSDNGVLSMPSGAEMTRTANLRRKEEKRLIKLKQKELPRFSYRRVIGYLTGYKHHLGIGVFGALIAGAMSPMFAYLLSQVVVTFLNPDKSLISPGPMSGANLYAFCFAILGLAGFIGFGLQIYSFEKVGAVLTRVLRRLTFQSLMRQEVGFYDMPGHTLGALTARLATDAAHVNDMVGKAWGDIAQFIATIVTGLTISFIYAPQLAAVMIGLAPFAVYASYYQTKGMKGFEDETKAAYEEASEVAAEAIKEIRTVEALSREEWFVEKYDASLDHPAQLGYKKAFVDSIAFALNGSVGQFSSALAFYAGMNFMLMGLFGFQDLFTCLMTIMLTAQALGRSTTFMSNLDKGKIAAVNTFEFLDRQSTIDPDAPGYSPAEGEFNPDFSFDNISFSYPARPDQAIFTGAFNVSGKKNQTLALVGPSGCGKSTTIGMLQRWYDCTGGTVSVGGHDVKEYQLKNGLRKHIALVGQEPVLFDMSIRENILWGTDEANVSQESIEEAAQLANIHSFVASLPDGYNTRVGDKGGQLSGGQKQRIAIARALIRRPKILLLDEATSALDSESEKIVQEAIDKASEGRTTVTIAHRLSTIQNADQIAVVNNGRIVELGRHFELLELNGVYADLVRQQDLGQHAH